MADDGLVYAEDDNNLNTKANRKMTVIGNGDQLTNLPITYPGQKAYCTADGGAFKADTVYMRNAANDDWLIIRSAHVEQSSTPVVDNQDSTINGAWRGDYITFPTTEEYYIITGFEWKNGDPVAGDMIGAVYLVDAEPLTDLNATPVLASFPQTTIVNVDTVQRVNIYNSKIIPKGSIVFAAINSSTSSTDIRQKTGEPNYYSRRNESHLTSVPALESRAWVQTTTRPYIKLYFKGYP